MSLDDSSHSIAIDNILPDDLKASNIRQNTDSEIYQSIGDIESYMKTEIGKRTNSKSREDLYSTPSNTRILNNTETPVNTQNYSRMQLLDDEDEYETHA